MHVLLVEDEVRMAAAMRRALRGAGVVADVARTGSEALWMVRAASYDVMVLDVMLPDVDGFEVCRRLRAAGVWVPIIMVTARDAIEDRVRGLDVGADDYLTKPFAMRELLARVRSLLRRAQLPPTRPDSATQAAGTGTGDGGSGRTATIAAALVAGDLEVDVARRQANLNGAALTLKPKEFDLLHYLVRNPGIVLSRVALLREVWGYDFPIDTRTVDVHVRWLRQKVEVDPSQPRRIETVRGFGYRFVPDPH